MERVPRIALLAAVGACLACATPVRVEFDRREEFSRYRTWAWLDPGWEVGRASRVAPELDAVLRGAIERELAARGYQLTADGTPDFFVTYHIAVAREMVVSIETPASQFLSSLHQGSPSYLITASERKVRFYETGTLAVDVADGSERQLVWRGLAIRRARNDYEPHAARAVAEILERFPPASGPGAGGDGI
jgi:hypothetical protein